MRRQVCHLQLLLALARTVIFRSKSSRTNEHFVECRQDRRQSRRRPRRSQEDDERMDTNWEERKADRIADQECRKKKKMQDRRVKIEVYVL
jgi:hypothetical protein